MKDIILVGSGGCMRELIWQIHELNKKSPSWNILGYTDNVKPENGEGVLVGKEIIKYLGTDEILLDKMEDVSVVVCVGSSFLRKKITENLMRNPNIHFPNLILSETYVCDDIQMGQGCIISMDARVSTNVKMGNFVFMNTGSMICHDGVVGDYVTLSPDVKLAGAVQIGVNCEIGIGTKIKQGISICEDVVIGAGAIVVKDIVNSGTFVGVPAKELKR